MKGQSVTTAWEDGFISVGLRFNGLTQKDDKLENFRLHERAGGEMVWEGFFIPLSSHCLPHPWRVHLSSQGTSKLPSSEIPSAHSSSSVLAHCVICLPLVLFVNIIKYVKSVHAHCVRVFASYLPCETKGSPVGQPVYDQWWSLSCSGIFLSLRCILLAPN